MPRGFQRRLAAAPNDLFCVFVLGGDGTFLSAVRWIGDRDTPVLGVKFGVVGFLAETAAEHLYTAAARVLANKFTLTRRMRLDVQVTRGKQAIARETVLNDIVINEGLSRGWRTSTPTSTATFSPRSAQMVSSSPPPPAPRPIRWPRAGRSSTRRCRASSSPPSARSPSPTAPSLFRTPPELSIRLEKGSSDILLTFDGQKGLDLTDQDVITVRQSAHPLNLINVPGRPYFDVLKSKLRWSGGRV